MTSRRYGLQGAFLALALFASCKEDPTAALVGSPIRVDLQYSYREIVVDDSVLVTATIRDAVGTPLAGAVTITSCDPGVVSIIPASAAPLPHTLFYAKANSFATSCVVATAAGLTDTMQVATFPAALQVTGPSTLASGASAGYAYAYLGAGAAGRDITAQVPAPTWSTGDATRATIDPVTGVASGLDFGAVVLTATGPGVAGSLAGTSNILVTPVAFNGTLSPSAVEQSGILTIYRGVGDPAFDTDTRVFFNRAQVDTQRTALDTAQFAPDRISFRSADSLKVIVADIRPVGAVEVVLSRVGAGQLSIGGDSFNLAPPPALAGTVSPSPTDPGNIVKLTPGGGPQFDTDTRVYFNGVRLNTGASLAEGVIARTPDSITVRINDLRDSLPVNVLLTRVGGSQNARSATLNVKPPASFSGTLSPNSGGAARLVKITRPLGGAAFDTDTRVYFGGVQTFVSDITADSIKVPAPVLGTVAVVDVLLTRVDAGQESFVSSYSNNTFSFNDPFDAVNNDPFTAPVITANGDYFVVLHGACLSGIGGTDCDDFFRVTNTLGRPDTISVNATWTPQAGTDVDIDLLLLDDGFNFCQDDGCAGATGANPENATIIIPAGQTYFIYLNLWDHHGAQFRLTRVRVSGIG